MLELKHIVKNYQAGEESVPALRDVSLCFRESEFVAILGPSGCGKTTLLNIIGGLDQYTSGDLVINGRSTKQFKDRDWDAYRNHSIGFVFQSYNLIPHQTVLANVELALTLSGVSKKERRQRAKEALERVGLGDQLKKRPNQMSGGQMQRVAIARALVNDPDILLADEPTGALDSGTSVQIMEILKEISQDKLIIMVTHNPELAEKYATRTVRLLDGKVVDDTAPAAAEETRRNPWERVQLKKQRQPSMSSATALSLSLNNLMTKKARTLLTAFAGSIGIIGIALILSLSTGIQGYIDQVQEDTLSSYPVELQAESMDMSSMVTALMGAKQSKEENAHDRDRVYSSVVMYDLMNSFNSAQKQTNNLRDFKSYLEADPSLMEDYTVKYSYDLGFTVYTQDADGKIVKSDTTELMEQMMEQLYGGNYSSYFSTMSSTYSQMDVWEEMLPGEQGELISPMVQGQYDLLYGHWPQRYDEVVLVVDDSNEVSDLVLYSLGLKTSSQMTEEMRAAMEGRQVDASGDSWSYQEICQKQFKLLLPAEHYRKEASGQGYTDISTTASGLDYLYNNEEVGTQLKIVGVIRGNEDAAATMLKGAIAYTSALTEYLVDRAAGQEIVAAQIAEPSTDILTGLPFATGQEAEPTAEEKLSLLKEYLTGLEDEEKAEIYRQAAAVPAESYLDTAVQQQMQGMTREKVEQMLTDSYAEEMGMDTASVQDYIAKMDDDTLFGYVRDSVRQTVTEQYGKGVQQQLAALNARQLAAMLDGGRLSQEQMLWAYDNCMPPHYSDSTYEQTLKTLGWVDPDSPSKISIYVSTFAGKDRVADIISDYNRGVEEEDQISYTDYVALLMSSITSIINAISYVLIAFVAISLVVSSIMIGIITYISVLERTKEIGILRSIGASKRDVSRVFNAETLIEGFTAGAIGIGITLLLTLPINAIIHHLTGIMSLSARLPWMGAVLLVLISMALTFVAGLIPSRIAAKKDPVVALRSE